MIMVLEYMSEYVGMFLGALALLVVQAICDLSLPDYMSDIVDNGVINGNVNYIVQTGGKMILITLLSAACMIVTGYLAARIAANTARDMRADVFKRVQTFSNPELDKFSPAIPDHPDHQRYHPDPDADCHDGAHALLFGHPGHRRCDQGHLGKPHLILDDRRSGAGVGGSHHHPLLHGDAKNADHANAGGQSEPHQPRKPGGHARYPRI